MNITEKLLTANGWEAFRDGYRYPTLYSKKVTEAIKVYIYYGNSAKYRVILLTCDCKTDLPAIRTMEQLAQLEYLLSDETSALETRLHATLVPLATPPGLRLRAGEREGGK